jgi:Tol biopolymer transport system component
LAFTIYGQTSSTGPYEHNGNRQLISWQVEQARTNRVLESNFNDWDPAISPDGTQVIFASDRGGSTNLFLVTLPIYSGNGTDGAPGDLRFNVSPVTQTTGCSNTHPSWLSDGSGIVYESTCEGGKSQIYRANLSYKLEAGAAVRTAQPVTGQRLTQTGSDESWPRVSPDGSRIVFYSNRDGNTEIYTMGIDGSSQTRLTNNASRDEGPVWSPDGTKIAFNSNRDGDHEIFVMNADGSSQTQLTNNSVDDGFAVWGP